mmetsp:Transcript_34771/g.84287  ORF Transcript_34771/g.84287 Transcript_34771/m.84287 type:complete len:111 (+) Transcript_34771:71-403(+)
MNSGVEMTTTVDWTWGARGKLMRVTYDFWLFLQTEVGDRSDKTRLEKASGVEMMIATGRRPKSARRQPSAKDEMRSRNDHYCGLDVECKRKLMGVTYCRMKKIGCFFKHY